MSTFEARFFIIHCVMPFLDGPSLLIFLRLHADFRAYPFDAFIKGVHDLIPAIEPTLHELRSFSEHRSATDAFMDSMGFFVWTDFIYEIKHTRTGRIALCKFMLKGLRPFNPKIGGSGRCARCAMIRRISALTRYATWRLIGAPLDHEGSAKVA